MNTASYLVYGALLPQFQQAFAVARGTGDDDDLLQELALAQLSGKTPEFARAAARRFREGGQGPRVIYPLDDKREAAEAAEADADDLDDLARDFGADAHVDAIARRHGVTKRRAYQIIAGQIRRAEACGDLFAGVV